MALIDKASLLFVPSVVAEGKAFNVLPSGNRAPDSTDQNSGYDQTRADFDFDRGSNAAATRIDSNGVLQKYRENLLLNSNQFDTTWVNARSSETSGQSGYDGTNNAWLLSDAVSVNNDHIIYNPNTHSGVVTYSVYAKANTLNWFELSSYSGGTTINSFFDLENGAIGSGTNIEAKIEAVGTDGWYRCSVTGYTTTNNYVRIALATDDNTTNWVGTNGENSIYIQNAQLESGLVSTDYLDSTSVTGKAGVLVDLPRINFDANGENGSLLLEPSRANILPQSEFYGSGSGWSVISNSSITDNAITSPEGNQNASYLTFTNSGSSTQFYRVVQTTGSKQVLSVFVKYVSGSGSGLRLSKSSDINYGINLEFSNNGATLTGTTGTNVDSYKIEDYGNQWFRVSIVINWSSSALEYNLYRYSGTGTDVYAIWGLQVEGNASYATSYIPTMGTTETRAADSCSVTGASDVIGQTEGTLFVEFTFDGHFDAFAELGIFASQSNRYALYTYDSTNTIRGYVIASNSAVFETNVSDALVVGQRYKVAFAVKSGDIAVYINGESKYTNNGTFSFNESLDEYKFSAYAGTTKWNQKTHQTILFNERLSNAELATLTTL